MYCMYVCMYTHEQFENTLAKEGMQTKQDNNTDIHPK